CDTREVVPVRSGDAMPKHDPAHTYNAEYSTQRYAGHPLADENSPPMPQAHFTQSHRTNDQCRGLRPRIPATADDQGNKQCQHDGLGYFVLKETQRSCGEHLTQKESRKPPGSLADHLSKSGFKIGLVQRFHAANLLQFTASVLPRSRHGVVDRHDALHHTTMIQDWKCEETMIRDEFR